MHTKTLSPTARGAFMYSLKQQKREFDCEGVLGGACEGERKDVAPTL